ncbi:MAG TPA: phosphomannomutase/phosphoglucomutase [Patescibacteria group bacterium]|nr:phosphomannomutase/phosphoglucomutase [Patescibacteria group bacterium]
MEILRSIFRGYDIRGFADTELTLDFARGVGRAFATLRSHECAGKHLTFVVGRDMRPSSEALQEGLIEGLIQSGVDVLDVGLISTPDFYFSIGALGADGGVIVTASHNPAVYNGFKFTREKAIAVGGSSGLQTIADLMEKETFVKATSEGKRQQREGMTQRSFEAQRAFYGADSVKPLRVVADSANGMGALYLDAFFEKSPHEVIRQCWELDGTFPNHEADPKKEKNLEDLCRRVVEEKADLGIATDGDGDRIFLVDEKGKIIPGHILRGLLTRVMLRQHPGATICYEVRPGRIVEDIIREMGGVPTVSMAGYAALKEHMQRTGAIFGGELSGHFHYAFPHGIYEGPIVTLVYVLQELTRAGVPLSALVRPYEKYVHSGEINFCITDKDAAMERVKNRFADGALNLLDGVSITYPDFWFNVRASNTEPVLRLNLEAVDRRTMEERRDELSVVITGGLSASVAS